MALSIGKTIGYIISLGLLVIPIIIIIVTFKFGVIHLLWFFAYLFYVAMFNTLVKHFKSKPQSNDIPIPDDDLPF